MTIKASASVTISIYRDTEAVTRYYKLVSSTASAPSKPTTNHPSDWDDTEPSYTSGSTNTLYFCDLTEFSDGTWAYSAVSKSSSYEAAKEAYNKAQNAQDTADSLPNYVASRGENLVTNGTCLLGNNKNFSGFSYDGSETYYAGGSFKVTSTSTERCTDEFIPVDVLQKYALSYYIKCSNASARFYDMLIMYDIDKNVIKDGHVMFIPGSTTTLAKELKNGDTTVYLSSVSGFNKTTTAYCNRGFIFWNYTNSKGYTYGTETYSRNVFNTLWTDSSAFNETTNTITLDSAWIYGTFPAGTPVSQCSGGNTHIYGNLNYSVTANTWTKKTAYWNGVGKNNDDGKFREGIAFIKLGWLMNYGSSEACDIWLSTVSLKQSANNSEVSKLVSTVDVEYYLSTSSIALLGGYWQTTAPTWVDGKYMWSRTKITDGTGNVTYSPSENGTCIAGATGATGNGIKSIVEQYYKSTSTTSLSGGSWVETYPDWENGKYIWTRSVITYTDNTNTTTTAVCVTGSQGASGKGVKLTAVTYQAGSSGTTAPTGTWSSSVPSTSSDKPYLWTRTIITYTDNTTSTSYSVGVPPNSVVSKGDVVDNINSELKIDGNCIDLTTGHFTINSENMTLDKDGNATFSGTITGASGNFTKGFSVDIPTAIEYLKYQLTMDNDSLRLGLVATNNDDPQSSSYTSQIAMHNGLMAIQGGGGVNIASSGPSFYNGNGTGSVSFNNWDHAEFNTELHANQGLFVNKHATINSVLDITNGSNSTLQMWSDSEGGNIKFNTPNKRGFWEMDAYNSNHFRIFHNNGSNFDAFYTFTNDGWFHTNNIKAGVVEPSGLKIGVGQSYGWCDLYSGSTLCGNIYINTSNNNNMAIASPNHIEAKPLNGGGQGWFAVTGNVVYSNSCFQFSARKYKKNIVDITEEIAEKLMNVVPVEFDYKNSGSHSSGFIADDTEKLFPHLIQYDDDGNVNGLNYIGFIPYIVKKIQMQQKEINEQQKEINELKGQVNKLMSVCGLS